MDSASDNRFRWLEGGGTTSAMGFRACGVAAGMKVGRDDMAVVLSDVPASVAGVFTSNKVAAAPVLLDRERVARGTTRAVVANAGCANACTGTVGYEDALAMATCLEETLGLAPGDALVASTGVIGRRLPMDRIRDGIRLAATALDPDGGARASRAILTTDTVPKQAAVQFEIGGRTVTIGGMCKGAGMIEPNLATMLCFITTDAAVASADLQAALRAAVEPSFNRVTVDGDQSTNDTVLLFANGASGAPAIAPGTPEWGTFTAALDAVCLSLAKQIARDGEGATKFVEVHVRGAATQRDALLAAKTIANSPLVKTAWFGGDPNWGRIISAVGDSAVAMDPLAVQIFFDQLAVYDRGRIADEVQLKALEEICSHKSFSVTVDLHVGEAAETVYTCDLSYEYVKINGEYTT